MRINNLFYRINCWLDKNEVVKFFLLLTFVGAGTIGLSVRNNTSLIISISSFLILSVFSLFRVFIMNGKLEFNRKLYKIPEIGESIVIKKNFLLHKCWEITRGTEWRILNIEDINGDWKIEISDTRYENTSAPVVMTINYFKYKKYCESKKEIRDKKLKKLGL